MRQQYLIIFADGSLPCSTNWWTFENNYNEGDKVFDIINATYTLNGADWFDIEEDHL